MKILLNVLNSVSQPDCQAGALRIVSLNNHYRSIFMLKQQLVSKPRDHQEHSNQDEQDNVDHPFKRGGVPVCELHL